MMLISIVESALADFGSTKPGDQKAPESVLRADSRY
jgi:hypothetical protein